MTGEAETHIDEGDTHRRAPEFFIVGHHKCGTTALYEILRRHPQIYMSHIKEPGFLASDLRSRFQQVRGYKLPESLEEYLSLFAGAQPGQRIGEATPSYLFSHTAAERIAELQPAARCIAIVREPASFLHSLHLQLQRSHVEEEKDLRKAIVLEGPRSEGRRIPRRSHQPALLQYSDHVRYVEQLRRYDAVLPREQMLVLIYDDFRRDNGAAVRSVQRFLDVEDVPPIEDVRVKETIRAMRSQPLDDLLHSVSLGSSPLARTARATIKTLTPRRLRRDAFRTARLRGVYGPVVPPEEDLMRELRHRYKEEVVALSEYLDRDLVSQWGYDKLG
jgi:hypothetical protein